MGVNYKRLYYHSWKQLKSAIVSDVCNNDVFPDNRYIFRGQKDEAWKLMASFDRDYGNLPFEQRKMMEKNFIHEFRKMCIDWEGKERFEKYNDLQVMTVGQHYGLPTRLLDWSYSLYISAFFAFVEARDNNSNVAIWIIDKENEIWKGEYGVSVVTCKMDENERQKYQHGIFTLNKSPERAIEDYVDICARNYNVEGALLKVVIPAAERKVVLSDLEMMGINYYNLYRGMEGCALNAVLKVIKNY